MNPTSLQNGFALSTDLDSVPPTQTQTDTMDVRSFFAPKTKTETPSTGLTMHDGTTYRLTLNGQVAWEGQMTAQEAETASRLVDRAIHDPTQDVAGQLNAIFSKPKTETKPTIGTNSRGDPCMYCLRKAGGKMVVGVGYGVCKECSAKWKQAAENPRPAPEGLTYEFEFTLRGLLKSDEVMEGSDDEGFELFTRVPTESEWKGVVYSGKTLRLPYNWGWDYPETGKYYELKSFTIPEAQWAQGERWTMRKVVDTMRSFYGASKGRRARSMGDHQFFEGFDDNGEAYFGS